jgi:hypothetical protein
MSETLPSLHRKITQAQYLRLMVSTMKTMARVETAPLMRGGGVSQAHPFAVDATRLAAPCTHVISQQLARVRL